MTEDQGDQIIGLLGDMLSKLRDLRTQIDEFTGYNTRNMAAVVSGLTGPTGYHLGDLNDRLFEVIGAISSLETTVDLK